MIMIRMVILVIKLMKRIRIPLMVTIIVMLLITTIKIILIMVIKITVKIKISKNKCAIKPTEKFMLILTTNK